MGTVGTCGDRPAAVPVFRVTTGGSWGFREGLRCSAQCVLESAGLCLCSQRPVCLGGTSHGEPHVCAGERHAPPALLLASPSLLAGSRRGPCPLWAPSASSLILSFLYMSEGGGILRFLPVVCCDSEPGICVFHRVCRKCHLPRRLLETSRPSGSVSRPYVPGHPVPVSSRPCPSPGGHRTPTSI